MKRIPLITITPTIKVQILHVMACWKALWNSDPPKKFQKIQLQIDIMVVCPKSLNSIYGTHSPLGVNKVKRFKIHHMLNPFLLQICSYGKRETLL
jgi:hypothetical protein